MMQEYEEGLKYRKSSLGNISGTSLKGLHMGTTNLLKEPSLALKTRDYHLFKGACLNTVPSHPSFVNCQLP